MLESPAISSETVTNCLNCLNCHPRLLGVAISGYISIYLPLTPFFLAVLLTVYDKNKVHLIKEILSDEIARHPENDRGSLFRDNTITTALMTAMLNAPPCGTYWDRVFSRIVADMNARVKVNLHSLGTFLIGLF